MSQSLPPQVLDLIARFDRNRDSYKSPQYNETQLRREFLDPFFKALGWDIDNEQGYAEAYKDVIHEDAIKVGEATKAPDYCFRIGGTRKFFLEAKKPAIDIKNDVAPAFQLRRYAWTSKLPLGILSDFEEFSVYDCRVKPHQSDKASVARILYIPYTEYPQRWDEIAGIFSRDAVLKGSFDRYAESNKVKRGTADVDDEFLNTIEGWRSDLARNLALRNPKLTQRELNFAVQRIIDRIIFLRIGEGRGIETYGRLQGLVNGDRIYPRLCQIFEEADARYNSGLFHFKPEKTRHEAPDELTLSLQIDDKLLREIIKGIYYPESPYVFSALPAEILGQVYEQFLGKVIRLTEGHQAMVEEKPEVKKAGGVYYTPAYIVDYIVENTVGKLLVDIAGAILPSGGSTGRGSRPINTPIHGGVGTGSQTETVSTVSPKSTASVLRRVSKLKVLDPACGSGSFLIGAYEHLLKWHLDYYTANDPAKWAKGNKPTLVQVSGGRYQLTIAERKRILLDNIYGVDIDAQAVETTKLSLLLKVLEGETQQTLQLVLRMFQERALPDLGDNIKCGNSLIGSDFYQQQSLNLLTDEERYRINVFDWNGKDGFPEIMASGGFDAVIGNPPYVRIQVMKEWAAEEAGFYKNHYNSAQSGNYDLYVVFMERGLSVLTKNGRLGYIVPNKFLNAEYGRGIRATLSAGAHLEELVHFGAEQVFAQATTYTCLSFLSKSKSPTFRFIDGSNLSQWRITRTGPNAEISSDELGLAAWGFATGPAAGLIKRLKALRQRLGDIADIFVGLQTSADDVFIMDLVERNSRTYRLKSKSVEAEVVIEKELLHPLLSGTDVKGYRPLIERQFILFPYDVADEVKLLPWSEIASKYPRAASYLQQNRKRLEDREQGRMRNDKWHGYIYLKNMKRQACEKVCVPRLVAQLCSSFDKTGTFFLDNVDVGGVTIKPEACRSGYDLPLIQGLLNSTLLGWFFPYISAPFRGGWMSANRQFLSQLPLPSLGETSATYRSNATLIRQFVDQLSNLHSQHATTKTPQEKTALERQISATDAQIDKLVYELYGLTEDEIKIVEGKADIAVAAAAAETKKKIGKQKSKNKNPAYADPPPAPTAPNLTPEQSYGDAAHYFSAKEEPPGYGSN
jgi:hypothetical protein